MTKSSPSLAAIRQLLELSAQWLEWNDKSGELGSSDGY